MAVRALHDACTFSVIGEISEYGVKLRSEESLHRTHAFRVKLNKLFCNMRRFPRRPVLKMLRLSHESRRDFRLRDGPMQTPSAKARRWKIAPDGLLAIEA
ncbi:MAG: hypothetical protein WAU57_16145 [Xanthobacteraceae bacterium]